MSETETMNETLNIVEEYVNRHQPKDYRLNVSRLGAQHEGDWWYVVVTPEPPDIRLRDYRDLMEQVAEDIEAEKQIKVLLVPNLPGD